MMLWSNLGKRYVEAISEKKAYKVLKNNEILNKCWGEWCQQDGRIRAFYFHSLTEHWSDNHTRMKVLLWESRSPARKIQPIIGLKKRSEVGCIEEVKKNSVTFLHHPSPKLALISAKRDSFGCISPMAEANSGWVGTKFPSCARHFLKGTALFCPI